MVSADGWVVDWKSPERLHSHVWGPGGDGWQLSSARLLSFCEPSQDSPYTIVLQQSRQTSYTAGEGSESKCSKRQEVEIREEVEIS